MLYFFQLKFLTIQFYSIRSSKLITNTCRVTEHQPYCGIALYRLSAFYINSYLIPNIARKA